MGQMAGRTSEKEWIWLMWIRKGSRWTGYISSVDMKTEPEDKLVERREEMELEFVMPVRYLSLLP